jgi:chromosome segregation ATPase
LMEENPVEVRDVANLDPALNEAQAVDSVLDQYKNKTAPEVLAKVQEIKDNYSPLANLENKKTRLQKILDKTDPATKEHQVLSDKISKLDEKIRNKKEIGEQYEAKNDLITEERKGSVKRITQDEKDLNDFEQSSKTEDMDIKKYDMENSEIELQLEQLKARQKESFDIADDAEVTSINEDINDFNKNRRQIKDAIIDGINCVNNK